MSISRESSRPRLVLESAEGTANPFKASDTFNAVNGERIYRRSAERIGDAARRYRDPGRAARTAETLTRGTHQSPRPISPAEVQSPPIREFDRPRRVNRRRPCGYALCSSMTGR